MILFTFLLLTCFIFAQCWDEFYFTTFISCRHTEKPEYTYSVKFYEEDPGFDEDLTQWSWPEVIKRDGKTTNRTVWGKMDGDGPGEQYEIYMEIEHDCNRWGKKTRTKLSLTGGYCVEGGGDCQLYIPIDVTDLNTEKEIKVAFEQNQR